MVATTGGRWGWLLVGSGAALASTACAGPSPLTVETAPICGEDGPRRILALAIDEEVERVVEGGAVPAAFGVVALPPEDAGLPPSARVPRRVSLGDGCGDVAADVDGARLVTTDGVAPLACRDEQLWIADDPDGPRVPAAECRVGAVEAGLVTRSPGTSELWLREPGSGAAVRQLADGLVIDGDAASRAWVVTSGRVFVLLDNRRVLLVDPSGPDAVEVLAEEATDLLVAGQGRFVLWQEGDPLGPVSRIDLQTSDEVVLAPARIADEPHAVYGPYVVLRQEGGRFVYRLDTGARVSLPNMTSFVRDLPDGRIWLHRDDAPYGERDELVYDPVSGARVDIYAGPGVASWAEDGMEIHVPSEGDGIQLGTLLLAAWDGSGVEVVAEDVGWHRWRLDDGRVLSVRLDTAEPPIGGLWLHDPADGSRRAVADDVLATSLWLNRAHPFEGDMLWIGESGGGRELWRVRVPAR